jgi:hypothetical protein
VRRLIYGIVVASLLTFTAVAMAYPPATVTDVKPDSVTLRGLDCGTQYQLQLAERNATNTGWESSTTQTVTTAACTTAAPTADFSVSPDPAVRNKATTFTSTGTCAATPCTYRWLHGDASSTDQIGTGPTATFTYTGAPGPRTVTLEVTDSQNREAVRTQSFQLVEPSATPTPTPTPPPAPSPTPAPSPSGFPDASNTGVPAGTSLSAYTGPSTVSAANTVIDGKTIGCLRVTAPGVVIRRSKITCSGGYAVLSADGDYSGAPLLIEDSELDCTNTGGTALGEANITVRRANIHGCENGGDINQNITIEDSYIHDLYTSASAHTDGLQFAAGHTENGQGVAGSLNVTIRHNTIYGIGADGSFGTSAIISNRGADKNVIIDNNLLAGGAYTLYCEQGATGNNYRVTNNAFSQKFSQKVGAYGPATDCSDETQSGNHYYETGQPLSLD